MSKNLLSENMLRFGTKNLNESQKRNLVLESVMQTIKEHGLYNEVKRRLNEGATIDETAKNLYDAYGGVLGNDKEAQVVSELASIKNITQYNQVNAALKKLTDGKGIFSWIASFMQGDDLRNPDILRKGGGSVIDHLMRLWYPDAYKQYLEGSPSAYEKYLNTDPFTKFNMDRSVIQTFKARGTSSTTGG